MPETRSRIAVKVHPNSPKPGLAGFVDGILQAHVSAAPVKGQANKELVALLADALGTSKSDVAVVLGHTNRNKLVAITGLSREEVVRRLSSTSSAGARE